MCIAIVKPMGVEMPVKSVLRTCWENNPDGAGLMYNNGENVVIHKGFTKFKGLWKYLKQLDSQVDLKDKDLVIHFRIATSGGVNRECTHPFPVTHSIVEMKKLDSICDYGFAHNGIISGYGSKEFSDTMEYVSRIISNIPSLDKCEKLLDELATDHASRFVLLTKDNFELGGNWVEDNGCYYSNDTYRYSYFKSCSKSSFDWDDWYENHKYCECCETYVGKDEAIQTNLGWLCQDCYDYLIGRLGKEDFDKADTKVLEPTNEEIVF